MLSGLANPLAAARVISALYEQTRQMDVRIEVSTDLDAFASVRSSIREEPVSPFFDPTVTHLDPAKAFWTAGYNAADQLVSLQAFRLDVIDSSLADWALGFVIGIYVKRGELILPARVRPPRNSITERIRGRVVYHGEIWISKDVKKKEAVETIPLLGMFIAFVRWNPDAMWGIIKNSMATKGFVTRIGYAHMERGFFEWEWLPQGAERNEWIAISERSDLEYMVEERAARLS
ncbi:MAG: hypothetical protein M3N38_05710 [Pseudomonadota bacterium]|nr:hypothetical protein [Pseudomonadota bacterium]